MRRKIKVALYIRVALLIGPGLCYYLLTNTFIDNNGNKNDASIDDGFPSRFTSRTLLNVKDQNTRDEINSQHETETMASALKNDSSTGGAGDSLGSENRDIKHDFREMNKNGLFLIHTILACYCFWMLAIILDEYFLVSIEIICQKLKLKQDIVGASVMAMATSSPELFISCVSTFATTGNNVGVATVVGSAAFNILMIPALCGLFTKTAVELKAWPIVRDCTFYGASVILLMAVIYDDQIMWYEAASMVVTYGLYLLFMYHDDAMSERLKFYTRKIKRQFYKQPYQEVSELTPLFEQFIDTKNINIEISEPFIKGINISDEEFKHLYFQVITNDIIFMMRLPIKLILWYTIPDARRYPHYYFMTFVNCILWIICISYFSVYVSSNVDSLIGLTFLAAGTSIPEAISSVIVTKQGFGSMGISTSIGSNTFDILLCLGLPWLLKTLIAPTVSGQAWITLKSTGISYSTISLLTTLLALFLSFYFNKFHLDRRIGIILLVFYLSFLAFAFTVDANVLFPFNPTAK